MTAPWRGLAARCRTAIEGLFGRSGDPHSHGSKWVEPSNAITRAIYASLGDLDELTRTLYQPWEQARELAPDNVLIAASAPRLEQAAVSDPIPAPAEDAASEQTHKRDGTAA